MDTEELYKRYFHDVYLYLCAVSHDESLAEELTQNTFFKALRSVNSFRGDCDVRVWLTQIAKNQYLSYCKKQKRITGEDTPESPEDTGITIEDHLADSEQAMAIHRILHDMKEPQKEVFSLRVFGELSFRQIGEIFGKTEAWARVTFHRAKLAIIDELEDRS
ncbi:MAG: sigma-70 family RNA polymerase sigma factor [Oscillospiraceae bacterium]|nr:sigma-70 family RNA polymerase sigma factor [Oscillospiraceae bacterium]